MNKFFKIDGKWFTKVKCPECRSVHNISHKNYYAQKKGINNLSFRCGKCGRLRGAKTRRNPGLKKTTPNGYVKLYRPENPMADKRGEVYEHRLIMSQLIGRPLLRKEHVHHIDRNKKNNRRGNLALWLGHDHLSFHKRTSSKAI